jgi:hypothetical protein
VRILRITALLAAMAAGLWAQSPDKPLTNSDLESMLAAGLPESTILIKIQIAAYRGLVNVDASPAALAELKQKGATEQELNAVQWAEPFSAVWIRRQEENRAVPDLPSQAGVYFKTSSGWTKAGSFLLWSPFYSNWNWFHGAHEYSVPVGNGPSALQVREPQPTFYVREPSSGEQWSIIRVTSRKDQRMIHLAAARDLLEMDRIAPGQIQAVQATHVAGDIFTLRPSTGLAPGEYLLCTPVSGGAGLNLCYSFGLQK